MVSFPLPVTTAPMEAVTDDHLPEGDAWQYEPKWDGFRCLVFREGDDVELRSKSGQPLARYFPEVVEAVRALPAKRFVIDGELVVRLAGEPSFDALLQRIHPAASRVKRLAEETPATLVLFDILADAKGTDLTARPLAERRERLERFASAALRRGQASIELSPATTSLARARRWLEGHEGTDGVVAKRLDEPYRRGERAMRKVKRIRTADCVVGGFRWASKGRKLGSLLLGLYDDEGKLHHVGFAASFPAKDLAAIEAKVLPLRGGTGFTGQAPGGPSRWSTERSAEWEPLMPKLVVEVKYDHFTGGRFRHGTKLLRWRPEKAPRQCTLDQVLPRAAAPAKKSPAKKSPAKRSPAKKSPTRKVAPAKKAAARKRR
ncbi:MAG TPA: ATP-dependent DNA ligase [Gemmatimonadaceae bacterium]